MLPALAVALVTVLAPVAPVAELGPAEPGPQMTEAACSPPCGEINPRLIFDFEELSREPLTLSAGESATFSGTITLWADADDEGYVPPDPQEPIVIQFSFPRLPGWAEMTVEPSEIPVDAATCQGCFQININDPSQPKVHFAFTEPVELTVSVTDTPEETPGYDYGKLQLFAKSSESGIWNPGYGIKEVRIDAGPSEPLEENSFMGVPGSGLLSALAAVSLAGLVATWRRR